jgi:hypothetical protein
VPIDIPNFALVFISVRVGGRLWFVESIKVVSAEWMEQMVKRDSIGEFFGVQVSGDPLEAVPRFGHILGVGGIVIVSFGGHDVNGS